MFSATDKAELADLAARVQLGISDGLVVQSVTVVATGAASPAVQLQIGCASGVLSAEWPSAWLPHSSRSCTRRR